GDVKLFCEGLKRSGISANLNILDNGSDALDFLRKQGKYSGAVDPHLILLDLNLPKIDGREVLAEIKADEKLSRIPVVILTTSDSRLDVDRVYRLHANSFVTEPGDLYQFLGKIDAIVRYWLTVSTLP